MKQRLAIAATLIGEPEVLIFDEPTNGLDPEGISEVRSILSHIASSGRTVIMASHLLDEVEKICSHVAIIKAGTLLATGPVGSILNDNVTLEIDAPDRERLLAHINSLQISSHVTETPKWVECVLTDDVDIVALSRSFYEAGIIPTHFATRKKKLEEEFLEITRASH